MYLSSFLEAMDPWETTFCAPVLRYAGIRSATGLRILKGNLDLGPVPLKIIPEPIQAGELEVGHLQFPDYSGRIRDLISGIAGGGILNSSNGPVQIGADQCSEPQLFLRRFFENEFSQNSKVLSLEIGFQLARPFRDTTSIDSAVRAGIRPYENLKDLLGEYGVTWDLDSQVAFEVIIHRPLEFMSSSRVEDGTAILQMLAHQTLPAEKIRLGYKVFGAGLIRRESISGSAMEWVRERLPNGAEVNKGSANITVAPGSHLHCFGSYDGVCLHQMLFGDPTTFPNWRRAAYDGVDPSAKIMDEILITPFVPGGQSRELETAVASLFWMLGFSCLNLAGQKFSDGPDVLALTPQGRLLVVECTTGLPDEKDKLAKLTRRTELIRESIVKSGFNPPDVLPVVVSGLPIAEARGHLLKAKELGVAVLTKESILDGRGRIFVARDPDEIFSEIKGTLQPSKN